MYISMCKTIEKVDKLFEKHYRQIYEVIHCTQIYISIQDYRYNYLNTFTRIHSDDLFILKYFTNLIKLVIYALQKYHL